LRPALFLGIETSGKSTGLALADSGKVVAEMDRVTQSNSANAEESASGSEEIKYKANHMKRYIDELRNMVGVRQK